MAVPCSLWDLSSLTGDQTQDLHSKSMEWSSNHWTAREVLPFMVCVQLSNYRGNVKL